MDGTRGFRPWRKAFHAVSSVAVAVALLLLDLTREQSTLILAGLATAMLVFDLARLRVSALNRLFFRLFGPLVSPREAGGLASSTWHTLGMALVVGLFPLHDAVSAILVLGIADPAASFVGHRWGSRPFLGGTVAGTVAFVVTASLILAFRHPLPVAVTAGAVTALAERRSWPLDDNLAVPVACAVVLRLTSLA